MGFNSSYITYSWNDLEPFRTFASSNSNQNMNSIFINIRYCNIKGQKSIFYFLIVLNFKRRLGPCYLSQFFHSYS